VSRNLRSKSVPQQHVFLNHPNNLYQTLSHTSSYVSPLSIPSTTKSNDSQLPTHCLPPPPLSNRSAQHHALFVFVVRFKTQFFRRFYAVFFATTLQRFYFENKKLSYIILASTLFITFFISKKLYIVVQIHKNDINPPRSIFNSNQSPHISKQPLTNYKCDNIFLALRHKWLPNLTFHEKHRLVHPLHTCSGILRY
jgi:hypothetical protein